MAASWFSARLLSGRGRRRAGCVSARPARPDPHRWLAACCVLACALMMVVEYSVTCIWLPRQPYYQIPPDGQPVQGIAGPRPAPRAEGATLSEAVKIAIAQHRSACEAAAAEAQEKEESAAEPGPPDTQAMAAGGPAREQTGDDKAPAPAAPAASASNTPGGEQAGGDAAPAEPALEAGEPLQGDWSVFHPIIRSFASMVVVHPRASAGGDASPRYPLQEEYMWLEGCQLSSGAMAMTPQDRRINPYFANQAAMVLLNWRPQAVRRYIEWYLGHLNQRDRFGLAGTVYDYHLHSGAERSEEDYDAADSYAATFLSLVARYVFATGDAALVIDRLDELETVARVCTALKDEDGLTWAKADHRYKFLMDNCEVARGLADWAEVLRTIGLWKHGDAWARAADRVQQAVEDELWSEQRGEYAWAKTARGPHWVRRRWYPDTVGQLYPVIYGLVDPHSERGQALIRRVNAAYPHWAQLSTGDNYPWALAAYAHALAGEREQALKFADQVWERFLASGRPWPWYNLEGAYFILTLLELAEVGASAPVRR